MPSRKRTTLTTTDCPVAQGNFDSRKGLRDNTNLIVIHTMAGFKAGTRSTFANPNLAHKRSANYGVNMDGSIDWYVDEDLVAYHASNWEVNRTSIGIEHEDYNSGSIVRTDALYESSSKLVADICKFYNIPCDRNHIIPHTDVPDENSPDGTVRTGCPGTLDIDRIISRAREILTGVQDVPALAPSSMRAVVITTLNLVVRNTPNTSGIKLRSLTPGSIIQVELEVNGQDIEGVSKWWKLQGEQAYVWGGGIRVDSTPTPVTPAPTNPSTQSDELKAGTVIKQALPQLKSVVTGGQFGNAEQAAREMVDRWGSYRNLIIAHKEAKSVLEKLAKLFGITS